MSIIEKCPECGELLSKDEIVSHCEKNCIDNLRKQKIEVAASRDAWKADAERLFALVNNPSPFCCYYRRMGSNGHSNDCPIELHRKLESEEK